jgi:hypothetical protein
MMHKKNIESFVEFKIPNCNATYTFDVNSTNCIRYSLPSCPANFTLDNKDLYNKKCVYSGTVPNPTCPNNSPVTTSGCKGEERAPNCNSYINGKLRQNNCYTGGTTYKS